MGTRIHHAYGLRYPHAYKDNSIPDLDGWHSESYVCGDIPPHYPVPAIPNNISTCGMWLKCPDCGNACVKRAQS